MSSNSPKKIPSNRPALPIKSSNHLFDALYVLLFLAAIYSAVALPRQRYLILFAILLILSVIVAVDPRVKRSAASGSLLWNFALTVSATSIGLFLGLYLSNRESDRIEVDKAHALASVAAENLHATAVRTGIMMICRYRNS